MWAMAMEPVLSFDLKDVWETARRDARIKHEALASLMGLSSQQLSHQLAGVGHPSLRRLMLLASDDDGKAFLIALAKHLAIAAGFDLDALLLVARLERVAGRLIDRVQKRVPVKAELREREERKQA